MGCSGVCVKIKGGVIFPVLYGSEYDLQDYVPNLSNDSRILIFNLETPSVNEVPGEEKVTLK